MNVRLGNHEVTDEELMLAYQKGESRAFDLLYDRIAPKIYGYLRRRLVSDELVDDVFQSTMVKFHSTRMQYRPNLLVLPWIFTICRTVMIDNLRKQGRRKEVLDGMQPDSFLMKQSDEPNETITSALPTEDLLDSRSLSPSQKKAVALRFQQDLSFEEIAEQLSTTPNNARQLVSRALKKIKSLALVRGRK